MVSTQLSRIRNGVYQLTKVVKGLPPKRININGLP
jgi:hypothetical protein